MEPIRQPLDAIARNVLQAMEPAERVISAWPLVCGQRVAAHARALEFADGKLRVAVHDPIWRNELTAMAERHATRLSQLTGVPVAAILFTNR